MEYSNHIVTRIPLDQIWSEDGLLMAVTRHRMLSEDTLKNLIRFNPVQFVIANVSERLQWIPLSDCFRIWKSEIKEHLVADPGHGFELDDFPGCYAYLASEWSPVGGRPIVLLEKYH